MNLFDLSGKVALITGGNGGIGLGIAEGLAGAGASVALLGRNVAKTENAATDLSRETGADTLAIAADVTDAEAVARALNAVIGRFGRLDILVNNAGIIVRKLPQEMTDDEWRRVMDGNVTSAFLMARAAYPHLKASGTGKVINIGSMASTFGSSYAVSYAASKGAVVQLTRSLALAWAVDNIQVNAILPGWFDTEMTERARVEVPGLNERVLARTPQKRWAKPSDMAGTAVWLASHASDFVTGVAVPVDGGYSVAL